MDFGKGSVDAERVKPRTKDLGLGFSVEWDFAKIEVATRRKRKKWNVVLGPNDMMEFFSIIVVKCDKVENENGCIYRHVKGLVRLFIG